MDTIPCPIRAKPDEIVRCKTRRALTLGSAPFKQQSRARCHPCRKNATFQPAAAVSLRAGKDVPDPDQPLVKLSIQDSISTRG
jgi:hypothetical protein